MTPHFAIVVSFCNWSVNDTEVIHLQQVYSDLFFKTKMNIQTVLVQSVLHLHGLQSIG